MVPGAANSRREGRVLYLTVEEYFQKFLPCCGGNIRFVLDQNTRKGETKMKKPSVIIAAVSIVFSASLASFAMDNKSMPMEHGGQMMHKSNIVHEEVADGVKVAFALINMKEQMKGMEMPAGMKETHHLMVEFKDAKSGKELTKGEVKVKVIAPDNSEQVKNLMSMGGMAGMGAGFGADFDFSKKGKYGVMVKFKLSDGKVRSVKFWYTVK